MQKDQELRIARKFGLLTFAALVLYFFLMKLLHLIEVQELRAFNGVIIFIGVAFAIHKLKDLNGNKLDYLHGIGSGVLTALIGVTPFAFFVLFYLLIDSSFLVSIQERSAFGDLINPFTGAFVNFIEGMASGMIASFMTMQYFKPSVLKQMQQDKMRKAKVLETKI